jgi:hypothetical protein
MNLSGCMNNDIGKHVRIRRFSLVIQSKDRSIKNNDRYSEKIVMFKQYPNKII